MADLSNVRTGRITSSEIVALTKSGRKKEEPGAPFYTYVKECIMERFFKQSLENKVEVLAMSWGLLCEKIVHDLLGFEYQFHSNKTFVHPKYPEWCGSPDGSIEKTILKKKIVETVTETKCPLTRKAFYNLVSELYEFDGLTVTKKKNIDGNEVIQKIRENSPEGEKYYQQIVSNACIVGAKYGELIVFMPYFEQLELIQEYNNALDESFWFVARAKEGELPFIYKESGIENLNVIRFLIPVEDKEFLESRVIKAIELINA
jgi:hypothetical protein